MVRLFGRVMVCDHRIVLNGVEKKHDINYVKSMNEVIKKRTMNVKKQID